MLMLPVQKPMSQNEFFLSSSIAAIDARRIGILVIILLLPLRRWKQESGIPNPRRIRLFRLRIMQLGLSYSLPSSNMLMRSRSSLPRFSPTYIM